MPPKFKFTRDEIITTALNIVRENGIKNLTARSLAEKLGSSPKVIFGSFSGMEEVFQEVFASADKLYNFYISESMKTQEYPIYKASGLGYIRFAKEEKELFKLLFMRDRTTGKIIDDRESIRPILEVIMKNLDVDEDAAVAFHLQLWIYVHGIATMIATNYLDWNPEFIDNSLTEIYCGLKYRFTGEN